MACPKGSYITGVLKGLQCVLSEAVKLQDTQCKECWKSSTLRNVVERTSYVVNEKLKDLNKSDKIQKDKNVSELLQRSSMILEGIFAVIKYTQVVPEKEFSNYDIQVPGDFILDASEIERNFQQIEFSIKSPHVERLTNDSVNIIESAVKEPRVPSTLKEKVASPEALPKAKEVVQEKPQSNVEPTPLIPTPTARKPSKKLPTLSDKAKERAVPASRIARVVSFGTLAAGLGIGTVAEITKRTFGLSDTAKSLGSTLDKAFITPANAERIVNTLCKVRGTRPRSIHFGVPTKFKICVNTKNMITAAGAALKIGQIFSIQDTDLINPEIQKLFERVRQSADFMPTWQVESVMKKELGDDWKSKFTSFDVKPFAAASIGQVHAGILPNGKEVAIKIQYPGVAQGIESDIDNLMSVLKIWNIFPKGMFIDNLVDVAKRELAWEVDYVREAECTRKFKELLAPYPEYYVPEVIDELCTSGVFTTELIEGTPVDKCIDMDFETRCRISMLIQSLVLKEMFEFRYMQTDPNWSNFFYNPNTKQLVLLDFGASRSYSKKFMDQYLQVVKSAVDKDRVKVLKYSERMGFLTGYESKIMQEAHVDAVMILGEILCKEGFDFGLQNTVKRIQSLVPTILHHRLCPPPEEVYSLHRKLSGAFLLYTKLKAKLSCNDLFMKIYNKYEFDENME